jgi:glutamyl-tRNA synthetase
MLAEFQLEHVNNSPAFFDVQKLTHFNAEYIRSLPVATFVRESLPWLTGPDVPWSTEQFDIAAFERLAPSVQERVKTLADVRDYVDFVFLGEPAIDEQAWASLAGQETTAAVLDDAIAEYANAAWEPAALHDLTQAIGERHGLKLAKAQAPIRVAITGRTVGPPLFESLAVLGRDRTLSRLRAARARL